MKAEVTAYLHLRTDEHSFGRLEAWPSEMTSQKGFVFLGKHTFEIDAPSQEDINSLAIDELKKAIRETRAVAESKVNYLEERIGKLQALPAPGGQESYDQVEPGNYWSRADMDDDIAF